MDALNTALGLAVAAERHFCVLSSDPSAMEDGISALLGTFGINSDAIVSVNVAQKDLITPMMAGKTLKSAVIWRGVENLTPEQQRDRLLPLLLQLDNYDRNCSKRDVSREVILGRDHSYRIDFEAVKVEKPAVFCIIAVMGISEKRTKMHRAVKERFWFSQHVAELGSFRRYNVAKMPENTNSAEVTSTSGPLISGTGTGDEETPESTENAPELSENSPGSPTETSEMPDTLKITRNMPMAFQRARSALPKVYLSPEIQGYIYSLVVHCRVHRLCSLAPMHTRLLTRAVASINLLAATMVAWTETDPERWFVTTEHCKVAFRKVAYWLVDWEQEELYTESQVDLEKEYRKRMDFGMLTGDWVGSETPYIDRYLQSYKGKKDFSSLVGFTNQLVDDVLRAVCPPM